MINRMLPSALFAGFAAGLLAVLLQFVFVEKLILLAEDYETGARVHFAGVMSADGHDHSATEAVDPDAAPAAAEGAEPATDGHDHQHEAGEEASPLKRHALTVLFAALTYTGFALVLVAGFASAEMAVGHRPDLKAGLLWGLAGFAAFQLAPAVGLEPELPGTMAAALENRQIWWAGTAIATGGGLALLAFGRGVPACIGGLVLLALPHVIGAPELEGFSGSAPPELASKFAARSLAVGLVAWLALGAIAARLWTGKQA
jgi:cobalt transporter subunit CbtA